MANKIIELNPIYSRYTGKKSDISALLSYEEEAWYQGPFSKERYTKKTSLLDSTHTFLSGYTKRITDVYPKVEVQPIDYKIKTNKHPKVAKFKFRQYQKNAIAELLQYNRGVLTAKTGAGKTLIMGGIISMVQTKVLVIVPTKDLLHQTAEKLSDYFPDYAIGKVGDKEEVITDITVGLINSIYKNKKVLEEGWGMLLIDEAHRVSTFDGMYAKFLLSCNAPIRYGFTATIDPKEHKAVVMEGLIGPHVVEAKKEEVDKYLAKPKVVLIMDRTGRQYKTLRGKYVDIYFVGIVHNRYRNSLIIKEAKRWIDKGLTVLILVDKIEHGENLLKMANILMPNKFVFLQGTTKSEIRREEKEYFLKKKRKGVIATRIWGEGTDIKTIGVVINGVGGESEKAAIQKFGRGMRKAKGKEEVILVDIIDAESHKYFMEHSLKRVCYYSDQGWI